MKKTTRWLLPAMLSLVSSFVVSHEHSMHLPDTMATLKKSARQETVLPPAFNEGFSGRMELLRERANELQETDLTTLPEIIIPMSVIVLTSFTEPNALITRDFFSPKIDQFIKTSNEWLKDTNVRLEFCGDVKFVDADKESFETFDFSVIPFIKKHNPSNTLTLIVDKYLRGRAPFVAATASRAAISDGNFILMRPRALDLDEVFLHELAHVLGLDHTDDNHFGTSEACDEAGDRVCDTPFAPVFDIKKYDRKLCQYIPQSENHPPLDFPNNIMNSVVLTQFGCVTQGFTPGQLARIRAGAELFRNNLSCSGPTTPTYYADRLLPQRRQTKSDCHVELDDVSYTLTPISDTGITQASLQVNEGVSDIKGVDFIFYPENDIETGTYLTPDEPIDTIVFGGIDVDHSIEVYVERKDGSSTSYLHNLFYLPEICQ